MTAALCAAVVVSGGSMQDDTLDPLLPDYHVRTGAEIDALRDVKNEARSRWRRTHVELDSAARGGDSAAGVAIAIEALDEHRAALRDWTTREATFVAARLGFSTAPVPPRRARRG
jgi:hypothetical protein